MSSLLRLHRYRRFLTAPIPVTSSAHTPTTSHHKPAGHVRQFSLNGAFTSISNSAAVAHFQDGLVRVHDVSGLPWWATIMLSTVVLRAAITLPLTVYQHHITARIEQITAEMPAIVAELKREAAVAKRQFQMSNAQIRLVYNRSVKKQWNQLVVRENCHPAKTFIVVWGQIPLWIVQSMALRNLIGLMPDPASIHAQITFTELTLGGLAWFPNLTVPDSSLIMPVTVGLLNLCIVELQVMSRKRESSKFQTYVTHLFRALSIGMIPISASVPAGLCLYWTTSSAFGLAQNLLMLSPSFRRIVRIPKTPSELSDPYGHLKTITSERLAALQSKFGTSTKVKID